MNIILYHSRKIILCYLISIVASNLAYAAESSPKDIFIEAESNQTAFYPQSQVIYTVCLYFRIPMQNAALTDPHADKLTSYRLSEGTVYQTERDGVPYRVLKRKYALFPHASGDIIIAPVIFTGTDLLLGRRIFAQGPRVKLNVQTIPRAASNVMWLPANHLSLTEKWSSYPLKFQIGEPVTRVITLQAQGVMETQLPDLSNDLLMALPHTIKTYIDPPQSTMESSDNGVIVKRQWKITYIPINATGDHGAQSQSTVQLPRIEIPWWNNKIHRIEKAELAALFIPFN